MSSYPYTTHLLDKVGESSGSRSAIPGPVSNVEENDYSFCEIVEDRDSSALQKAHNDVDQVSTLHRSEYPLAVHSEVVQQTPEQLPPASGSKSTLRKRKGKQPAQPRPQVDDTNGVEGEGSRKRVRRRVKDTAVPPVTPASAPLAPLAPLPAAVATPSPPPRPAAANRSEAEWAKINYLREANAVYESQQVRRANLHPLTRNAYDNYRKTWIAWCERHHYRDHQVTNARASRYFQEIMGEPDPLDPDFQPLRRQKIRKDAVGDYLMPETMDFYIKAVVDLWNEEGSSTPANQSRPGAETNPRKIAKPFMDAYKRKVGGLSTAAKAPGLRITEGYNRQGFKRLMKAFWTRNYVKQDKPTRHKLKGLRDRLNTSWTHFMMCRGEHTRMARLRDLSFQQFEFIDDAGQFTLGIVLTMLQGKTNADGKLLYGVVVRNRDVEICPIGSLAFYLFERFMYPHTRPDFNNPDWASSHLIFTRDQFSQMTGSTHYGALRAEMEAANIVSKKVTHAGRRAGAQQAQSAGATIEEIAQHANWLQQRVATHYLSEIPERVPLKLAGFADHQERFWLARNTLIPPVELQKLIFPVVNDAYPDQEWQTWMENIMMDRDEYTDRRLDHREAAHYPEEDSPKIKFFIILVHMRKVILQDAAALMEITTDSECQYCLHRIFHEPVFSSRLFLQFRESLREKMATSTSPTNDSLLANAPTISTQLRDISEQLAGIAQQQKPQSTTADLQREREIWTASIARLVDQMRSDLITMHNSHLASINAVSTDIRRQLDRHLQGMQEILNHANGAIGDIRRNSNTTTTTTIPPSTQMPSFLNFAPPASEPSCSLPLASEQHMPPVPLPPLPLANTRGSRSHSPSPTPPPQASYSSSISSGSPTPARLSPGLSPAASPQLSPTEDLPEIELLPAEALPEREQPVSLEMIAEQLAWPRDQPTVSTYTMRRRPRDIEPLWQEWFHGLDGAPSIWQMDRFYKWRKNANAVVRKHYAFNRTLIEGMLKIILRTPGPSLERRKEAAFQTFRLRMARAGSLNQYSLQLRSEAAIDKEREKELQA